MVFVYFIAMNDLRESSDLNLISGQGVMVYDNYSERSSQNHHVVYALHDSGYVARTYARIDEEISTVESIFESIKVSADNLNGDVQGLIPASANLLNYSIDDDILVMNLSESFLYYMPSDEEQLISMLVWSMTELENVERVYLQIDGKPINNLNSGLNVGRGLTRQVGINLEVGTPNLADSKLMMLYFLTDDSDDALLVPVTRLVSSDTNIIEYAVSSLIMGPLGKSYISVFDHNTTLLDAPSLDQGLLTLNFSSDLYYDQDQTKVSSSMLRQLVMTMTEFNEVSEVSVIIEGNVRVFDDGMNPIAVPVSRYDVGIFVESY